MEWVETQEIAASRARLRNKIQFGPRQCLLQMAAFALIPALGIPLAALINHKTIIWKSALVFTALCGAVGGIVYLLQLTSNWNRVRKCKYRIVLDDYNISMTDGRVTKTAVYNDLVGFSIFNGAGNSPANPLLVFGEATGKNLSIGIPPEISPDKIRGFLSGKLKELSNQEIPEPQNPYRKSREK